MVILCRCAMMRHKGTSPCVLLLHLHGQASSLQRKGQQRQPERARQCTEHKAGPLHSEGANLLLMLNLVACDLVGIAAKAQTALSQYRSAVPVWKMLPKK